MTTHPRIYPTPRLVTHLPGRVAVSQISHEDIAIDAGQCTRPGEYRISIAPDTGVRAIAHDEDGVWSARSVITQIIEQTRGDLAAMHIEDWPAFRTRGVMLDVSRDRIPTMTEFRNLIELLSRLRMNHLQLYVEHTFQYPGHEAVCEGLNPITPNEIRVLDGWCQEHGIELAANQNCFGHLSGWLRHPAYAELAETHGQYDFYGLSRSGPFSLCPTDPRSLALVREWLAELSACFSSRRVNIGCDETADIGTSRSADAVASIGKSALYSRYVSEVAGAAESFGLKPMFWADIALDSPEILGALPRDMLALAWGYEPDSPFERWDATLREAGRDFWVCPGTSCWRSYTGRTRERRGSLLGAATCRDDASGMLVTAWGDIGHQQQWPITAFAIADAAQAAWSGGEYDFHPHDAARVGLGHAELGPWLDAFGDADASIRATGGVPIDGAAAPIRNATALFETLHPARPGFVPHATVDAWGDVRDRLASLAVSQPHAGTHIDDELKWTLEAAVFAADTAFHRATSGQGASGVPDHDERIEHLIAGHRALWQKRSRPGGLDQSCSHLHALRWNTEKFA